MTFQEYLALSKEVFIEVAHEELLRSTPKVNTSRIAALSGLHRKQVEQVLRKTDTQDQPEAAGVLARVIAQWTHNELFLTKAGRPRVLRLKGPANEFRELVHSVSKALNPGTILFELKRSNLIKITPTAVRLLDEVVWIGPDAERGLQMLARDIELLSQAVDENLTGDPSVPHLHMRTEYDNVFLSELPQIRKWFAKQGDAFHKRARRYLAKFDKDTHPRPDTDDQAGALVAIGGFSITLPPSQTTIKSKAQDS